MSKVKIFISHASEDHKFVFELGKRLKKDLKELVDVFIDDWEIRVGDSIVDKINKALEKADFFIIVLSPSSIKKRWVQMELEAAIVLLANKKTKILPIWLEIDEDDVPSIIRPIKAARFTSATYIDEHEYEKLLEPIKDKIKADGLLKFQDKFLDNIKHIDIIAKNKEPTIQEIEFVLNLIKSDASYERYIFQKLISHVWFEIWKRESYFSPNKVPRPERTEEGYYRIPYWNPLDYLERLAEQIKENKITGGEKIKYAKELLEIIKNISTYRDEEGNHIDNYHVWHAFIKILSHLPNELITMDIIDLIPIWLDSRFLNDLQADEIVENLLPKFLTDNREDIEKAERIIHHIIKVIKKEEKFPVIGTYYLEKMFDNYSTTIGEKCSVNVIKNLAKKLKILLKNETHGTLYSFYDRKGYRSDEPAELLSYGLRSTMLAKAQKDPESLEPILEAFLKDNHFIFVKIALYVIAENMNKFRNLFFKIINTDVGSKIFEDTIYWGDELKHVLERLGPLDEEERKILNEKVEKAGDELRRKVKSLKGKELGEFITLHKQAIYKALSYDTYFKNLYEEMKNITGRDTELQPAILGVEVKVGWGKSPLSENDILAMSNEELAKYLAEFKTEDLWEGPTVEALAETLKTAAKIAPEKFVENLTPFINAGYLYISRILDGLTEATKEGRHINWDKILDFILSYIDRKEFWKNKLMVEPKTAGLKATYAWVIGSLSSLIMAGIENELYPLELFEKTENILLLILNNLEYETKEEISDYMFYALNTPLGQTLQSYIRLVLKTIQVTKEKPVQQDGFTKFKAKFDELLKKNAIEAYVWLGGYLPGLYYLDKEWVKEKIAFLEGIKHTLQWEAFMSGYLFGNTVHKEIYKLMKEHYKSSINYKFKSTESIKNLIAHISLAYLHGEESLEPSSLFYKIMEEFNTDYIKEIIRFFWRQAQYLQEDNARNKAIKERILLFWQYVYDKLRPKKDTNSLSREDEAILSEISLLTVFLPALIEKYKDWLLLSAPYVEKRYNISLFIEYLDELKDKGEREKTAQHIGEVFLAVLEAYIERKEPLPSYPEERIKSIVEFLCGIPISKEYGRQICNLYAKNGLLFLKDIYEKCESGGDI